MGPVLLVDTGNVFASPYVWSGRHRKRLEAFLARCYRRWGYQAVALGWGDYSTLERGVGLKLPWVSANVSLPGVRPFKVVRVGNWRVAVTGITGKGGYSLAMDWRRPRRALREVLSRIPDNVDLVLLLLASPARGGERLGKRVDVVLGGVYGRGRNKRGKPPYLFWLRIPRGGQMGMVTLEKGVKGVRLVSFKAYTLNSRVPGDPKVEEEIDALVR